ncbi:MAG: hypothetical protein IKC26_07075 [Clostridia bacterium]|nr:hypothetical protein [Clostridia bacterium]
MQIWNMNTALNTAADAVESAAETLFEGSSGDISSLFENVDPMRFVNNLTYMGIGMLGIFIVMSALILGTAILNKSTNRKEKK